MPIWTLMFVSQLIVIILLFFLSSCNWQSSILVKINSSVSANAPTVVIVSKPQVASGPSNIQYTFSGQDSSGQPTTHFVCELNSGGYSPCTSPHTIPSLSLGVNQFSVRAIDAAGNLSAPERYQWTVLTESWNYIGEPGSSLGTSVSYPSITRSMNGTISMTALEAIFPSMGSGTANARVQQWTGVQWIQIGGVFSVFANTMITVPLKVSASPVSNDLYIAFTNSTNANLVTVQKWDGAAWVAVGAPGLGVGMTSLADMAVDFGGNVYVAESGSKNIQRWNGAAWVIVGGGVFTADNISAAPITKIFPGPSGKVYVYYYNTTLNGYRFKEFDGTTWLAQSTAPSGSLAVDNNGSIFAVSLGASPNYQIALSKWNGATWDSVTTSGPITGQSNLPVIGVNQNDEIYVIYPDINNFQRQTVSKWNGSTWSQVGSAGFNFASATVNSTIFAADGSPWIQMIESGVGLSTFSFRPDRAAHVVSLAKPNGAPAVDLTASWVLSGDPAITNQEIQFYSDENCGAKSGGLTDLNSSSAQTINSVGLISTFFTFRLKTSFDSRDAVWSSCSNEAGFAAIWEYIGGAKTFISGNPYWDSQPAGYAVSPAGKIYVSSENNQGSATVFKWDGSSWGILGTPNLTGNIWNSILAVGADEKVFMAYPDSASGWYTRVKQWDGMSWVQLGTWLTGGSWFHGPAIAVHANVPYVAYSNFLNGTSYSPSVSYWDGAAWQFLGPQQIVNHTARNIAVAVAPVGAPNAGQVFISFQDVSDGHKLTVMNYNGAAWSYVGGASGMSTIAVAGAGNIDGYSSVAVDGAGDVYVSYAEPSNGYRVVVKKWNGAAWTDVDGAALVVAGATGKPYLSVNPTNNHVVLANNGNSKVIEWNGTSWTTIGAFVAASNPQLGHDAGGNIFAAVASVFTLSVRQFFP